MPMTENFNQDASGNVTVAGTGVAGTPAGGVITVQGQTGGTAIPVVSSPAATATLTQVASSSSSVVLLPANANRKGFVLYNNSTKPCSVAFAATATTAAFTVLLQTNSLFEGQVLYTGVISGIWTAVNGNMQVTELT